MSRILVVDDDPSVLAAFEQVLVEQDYEVTTASRGAAALEFLEVGQPDLIVMDIRMPGLSGLETFARIRKTHPKLPVIIMTGFATMETAIEAMQLGAFDYHVKPLNPEEILRSIDSALECVRLMARQVRLDSEQTPSPEEDAIIGQSRAMQEVYKAVGRVAATDAAVLIRGETGTGKELVARAIYHHSLRANAPLVVLNCAAIPEPLLESELFGHERGAFTGADNRRIGKLEQGNGGTLFLDEIGDMPLGTQAKLLRVLQDKSFERVGGGETMRVDLRILAATNRDLENAIAKGQFRQDLYHRLKVFCIEIGPLRERMEDVPRLAAYFLDKFSRELSIERPLLAPEAVELLCRHTWPGNVRELEHCIHRVLIFTPRVSHTGGGHPPVAPVRGGSRRLDVAVIARGSGSRDHRRLPSIQFRRFDTRELHGLGRAEPAGRGPAAVQRESDPGRQMAGAGPSDAEGQDGQTWPHGSVHCFRRVASAFLPIVRNLTVAWRAAATSANAYLCNLRIYKRLRIPTLDLPVGTEHVYAISARGEDRAGLTVSGLSAGRVLGGESGRESSWQRKRGYRWQKKGQHQRPNRLRSSQGTGAWTRCLRPCYPV